MKFRQISFLVVALTMVAALVGCSSSSNSNNKTVSITASAGTPQSATVGTAFGTQLQATVTTGGTPTSGVSVTFTAPSSGASGTFANGGSPAATDTETTNSSGVATSTVFTANSTAGSYTITATATGATSPASFNMTNTAVSALAAGNYVFSVAGTDSGAGGTSANPDSGTSYFAAGVIAVTAAGNITGEMSFSDWNYYVQEPITSGTVAVNPADTNLLITINTGDVNIGPGGATGTGTGTLVFSVAMASSTRGLLTEYDSWATSVGELNAQTSTAALCPTAPCGYAIYLSGIDGPNAYSIGVGGVITIDGANGSISGTGTVFDSNDAGTLSAANIVSASSVSAPDSMGYVTITINGVFGGSPGVLLDGYIIDANHIRLVEDWYNDSLNATTGGTALAQTGTGAFTTASISGSTYVVSLPGADVNGVNQVAGALTFNSNGTVSGNLSFNDITGQSPQGGTAITGGTWADDASGSGRVLLTGATDGATFSYNLILYETGDGHATVLSMDGGDMVVGLGWAQVSGLGVSTLTGSYVLNLNQFSSGVEFDGVGQITINTAALSLAGFVDENGSLISAGLTPNNPLNATYSGSASSPIISIAGGGGSTLTLYLIDGTQGVVIENDNSQLTLGYVTNQ